SLPSAPTSSSYHSATSPQSVRIGPAGFPCVLLPGRTFGRRCFLRCSTSGSVTAYDRRQTPAHTKIARFVVAVTSPADGVDVVVEVGVVDRFPGIGAVEVFLHVCVAVLVVVLGTVVGLIGIEAMLGFPVVRHAVLVGVDRDILGLEGVLRVAADLL